MLTTTIIRLAEEADIPAILDISNHYARNSPANFATEPEPLEQWLSAWRSGNAHFPWLVAAETGGRIVGFAKSGPWKSRSAYRWTAEVSVYLLPDVTGRGIGRGLYEQFFAIMKRQGYHSVIAGITQPNPASVKLHESLGMMHIGTFRENGWKDGRWHDVGYWMLLLNPAGKEPSPLRPAREVIAPGAVGR